MPMTPVRRGYGAAAGGSRGILLGRTNHFRMGDWKAMCWTCARIYYASELKKLSNLVGGGWVCSQCYEQPNPQIFLRGVRDGIPPAWTQPRPPPMSVSGPSTSTTPQPQGGSLLVNAQMVGA